MGFLRQTILACVLACASVSQGLAQSLAPLTGEVWGSGNKNVVVVLHGDGGPGRYDSFAAKMAKTHRGSTIITLNRPGYRYKGKKSPGRGGNIADLYTKKNNDLLAASLKSIKSSTGTRNLVVMGHSGGAGQLGTVIARFPGVVNTALLVGCPCDVPSWRISRKGKNNWTRSQSPLRFVKKIPKSTQVMAIVGSRDSNTKPRFSEKYVKAAKSAGKNAQLIVVPKGTHSWSNYQSTVESVLRKVVK